jgi:signal transduction histidine kinase
VELSLDGRAIQQALINLIDNAIKHSAKGQVVQVGISQEAANSPLITEEELSLTSRRSHCQPSFAAKGFIKLWVQDHGPGIPPSEHERIFERFYRVGSELRRETQGVGIGLSIVKHVVEAHGGAIRVQSTPGQGSTFAIELPLEPHTDR